MSEEASLSFLIPLTKQKEKWFRISHSGIFMCDSKEEAAEGKRQELPGI